MATATLYLDRTKTDGMGEIPIFIRFSHRSKFRPLYTGIKVRDKDLDKKKGKPIRMKSQVNGAMEFNGQIEGIEDKLKALVREFKKREAPFTADAMRAYYKGEEEDASLWHVSFKKWMEAMKGEVSDKTITNYATTYNSLEVYFKEGRRPNIEAGSITGETVNDYLNNQLHALSLDPATVKKRLSHLRSWLAWSKHPDIGKDWQPEKRRKLKAVKKTKVFLTEEEIKKLYAFEPKKSLVPVKEMFFRLILSGVRWSDRSMGMVEIHNSFIRQRSQKNNNIANIIMTEYLMELLKKPMPDFTIKHFNEEVKVLCMNAGINAPTLKRTAKKGIIKEEYVQKWKLISSKVGRKTLVSLLSAAGFTRAQIKEIIGNDVEIDAYEGADLQNVAEKAKVLFNFASPPAPGE